MLDVKFIRDNLELVEKSTKEKGYKINIKEVLKLDDARKEVLSEVEALRQKRNEIAAKMKGGKPAQELIKEGKAVKVQLAELEAKLSEKDQALASLIKQVPNVIFDDVPLGGEECSVEVKKWGKNHEKGVDHLDYAVSRDWVDFERGAKVAGAKFYYLKGEMALLENALLQYGLSKVLEHGFTFMTVPDMVSAKVLEGCGFNPRTSEQSDEYYIEGEDLAMIATAEMPLTGYHMDEIIFRVHQFNKLEMYVFCLPEQSKEMHEKILAIEEDIWQGLGVPYHIINIAAGDLGAPAAKKYDMEYWSPVNQKYQEITSCSNCTDFQARAVNCRVRRKDGSVEFVHTLNGTAIPLARALVVMLENFAVEGGKFKVPEVLRPYLGGKEEL